MGSNPTQGNFVRVAQWLERGLRQETVVAKPKVVGSSPTANAFIHLRPYGMGSRLLIGVLWVRILPSDFELTTSDLSGITVG